MEQTEIDNSIATFKKCLFQLGAMSDEAWNSFSKVLHFVDFKKGEFLTKEGELEENIYFIISGGVRVYVNRNEKEICTNFRFDNEFTSSISSFIRRQPSEYYIQTFVDSKFLFFNHDDLYKLYENHVDLNTLGRRVMEELLIDKRKKELGFLALSAEERYMNLLREHPRYIQTLTLKSVASFLGVAPETLSRIRSSIRFE